MNLKGIRADLQEALATVDGFTAYGKIPTSPELPCLFVGWPDTITLYTLGGGNRLDGLTVTIMFPVASDSADADLADAVSNDTISDAIQTFDSDWWRQTAVVGISNIRETVAGNTPVLAADFNIDMYTT